MVWHIQILTVLSSVSALYRDVFTGVVAPCDSLIFCYGPLLRDVQLAAPFDDSKTFVDLPTTRPVSEVLMAYEALSKPLKNDSSLQLFLSENFGEVGLEIGNVNSTLSTDPTFLEHVKSPVVADFVRQVIDIWPSLTREVTTTGALCDGCDSSFIPPKRPFVVAGGRFREVYYWDTFFILEGLLRTKGNYTEIAYNTIENFLDFIEEYGFVPNGGRKYYLNRSQPPLLSNMIKIYMDHTNDTSILTRALPLLIKEQDFFHNETAVMTSMNAQAYELQRYNVQNNQPRPESYLEDFVTANNNSYFAMNGSTYYVGQLNDSTRALLYRNLASGAESGWDYSSRWLRDPLVAAQDTGLALRSLNTVEIVSVDLQSISYSTALLISQFYGRLGNSTESERWADVAERRAESLNMFNYNETLSAYFDYNLTSGRQNIMIPNIPTPMANSTSPGNTTNQMMQFFSPAQFYPLAFNATLPRLLTKKNFVALYRPVIEQLDRYPGGLAATNFQSGQQWDSPNVWPPLQYLVIKSLLNSIVPEPLETSEFPSSGLVMESSSEEGGHRGGISVEDGEYAELSGLALRIAQRYVDSTYCTWRATGGSHPLLDIPRLPLGNESTTSNSSSGIMFEKYANNATNAVGSGGEYSTVTGFGWTNGVLIWVADTFGQQLTTPVCADKTLA